MIKGALRVVGTLVMLMSMGNVIAEDQSTTASNGTTVIVPQQIALPIPIPGGEPIETTANWDSGTPKPTPCVIC